MSRFSPKKLTLAASVALVTVFAGVTAASGGAVVAGPADCSYNDDGSVLSCNLPPASTVVSTATATETTTAAPVTSTVTTTAPPVTSTVTSVPAPVTSTATTTVTGPTVTRTVTAAPTTTATPPVNSEFTPIFTDTFDAAKTLFFVGNTKWTAYDNFQGTYKSTWYEKDIVSTHDGYMDMHIKTVNGRALTAAPIPDINNTGTATNAYKGQTYGRYSVDFRADAGLSGYKTAWLLWPDSNNWSEGEVDFPEGSLTGNIAGFTHTLGNPNANCAWYTGGNVKYATAPGVWNNAVIEWTPTRLTYILNGVTVMNTTNSSCIPKTAMHWVLQTEGASSTIPSSSVSGHLYIDNVKVWKYNR